jgi:hypothetical protein
MHPEMLDLLRWLKGGFGGVDDPAEIHHLLVYEFGVFDGEIE